MESVDNYYEDGTLSCEQFLDEEFKMRSEPNSRTSSIKYKKRPTLLADFDDDKRRNSLPITAEMALSGSFTDHLVHKRQRVKKVRSFRMTSKGIKNDIENERRQSNASIYSAVSQKELFRKRLSSEVSDDSAICCGCSSTSSTGYYRVCVMGADAVGKTALTNQFMTSDLLCSFDIENDEIDEQTLTVLIDNEESTLEFIDFSKHKEDIERNTCDACDAFIVVFSVHERPSFDVATKYLTYLRNELFIDRAIILVANKVDLVRKRQIASEEAKQLAIKYNCKYTETSATFNHQVDELLVGVLKQIKLKLSPEVVDKSTFEVPKAGVKQSKGPKGLLSKLFRRKSKPVNEVVLDWE
ncbi:ras-related protein O-RAL-like [Mytilus edulis]|uniref:ras-related protein O-RAL-like n=1 Tax=Mytilus edulis TaxID=6550 RepID=UPI0039EE9A8F